MYSIRHSNSLWIFDKIVSKLTNNATLMSIESFRTHQRRMTSNEKNIFVDFKMLVDEGKKARLFKLFFPLLSFPNKI